MRLGCAAIVRKRAEQRILPNDIAGRIPGDGTAGCVLDQVVALGGQSPGAVGSAAAAPAPVMVRFSRMSRSPVATLFSPAPTMVKM